MTQAKELYISLRDDPDLEIPEGETRESAAWGEMTRRVRQHKSNAKALSMAAGVKSPLDKLLSFTKEDIRIGSLQSIPSLDWIIFQAQLQKSELSRLYMAMMNGGGDGYTVNGVTYKHGISRWDEKMGDLTTADDRERLIDYVENLRKLQN